MQLEYYGFSNYPHKTFWEFEICIEVWFSLYDTVHMADSKLLQSIRRKTWRYQRNFKLKEENNKDSTLKHTY